MSARNHNALITLAMLVGYAAFADAGRAVPLYSTPGSMQDLDIGADGDVFAIGTEGVSGSNGWVYQWIHGRWELFGGYGTRVAVDPDGNPWIINALNEIWRYSGGSWAKVPGTARAIDIGADGSVFMLGQPSWSDGYVYRWNGASWDYFGGYGTEITVDREGHPWLVNSSDEIWRHTDAGWSRLSGTARDLDAGGDGTVYSLSGGSGANGYIYRWSGSGWSYNGGYGVRIAVAPTGSPAIINSSSSVWSGFVKRLHGDVTCSPTERDCNVCANDVKRQLDRIFLEGRHTPTAGAWYFSWGSLYAPSYLAPQVAFEDGTLQGHVQGFARTGHPTYPYVGSYSNKDDSAGTVFVIRPSSSSGRNELRYLHRSIESEWHPSGVHALGHYIAVDESDKLRLIDLDDPYGAPIVYDPDSVPGGEPMASAGGGLGIARLHDGGYLVTATNPGGGGADPRYSHHWRLDGPLESATMTYLGGTYHQLRPEWGGDYHTSENLSLITECETGQIYAVHTTGDALTNGTGHWRLQRLEHGPSGPVFRSLAVYEEWQNMSTCYLRAAATAYADDDGRISIYCHQYDAFKDAFESEDGMSFVRRRGDAVE